jgi:predicted Abi (CAAX) family protease
MSGPKYISAMVGLLGSIFMLPEIEDLLKIAMFVSVILIAVAMQLFFFYGKLQDRFIEELYPKLLLQLYKSDDFVQFLVEKQKKKSKHEIES